MKKIFLLIIILLITGCGYDKYKKPDDVTLEIKNVKTEVYSELKIKDLIDKKNVKISNKDKVLNTNSLGVKNTTIEYSYKDKSYLMDVSYTVVDTTSPIILDIENYYYAYEGDTTSSNIDFCSSAIYIDNYDRNIKCKIEGTYDINKIGTYNLKYIISDKSKNIKEEKLVFEVLQPKEDTDENEGNTNTNTNEEIEENILFSDIYSKHKNKNTMIGIDVSRWQGDIDFNKIKKAGAEFVIIRMAVSNGPDDEIGLDSKFKENIKKAKKAGLKVGVYVYTCASSKHEIIEQAKFVRKNLNKIKLDLPIAYDFEDWNEINNYKLNTHDLISFVDEFYKILNKDGYEVMLYGSKFYLENVWKNNNYPVWLAHYIDNTSYKGNYIMWQMTNNGKIDGIEGNVDINIYYKRED